MSKQQTQITTLALPVTENSTPAGNNLLKKYLFHWPLFALCAIIMLIGAYFYLKVTPPVYPILATLEFKAPTASSASLTVNQSSTEQELDPINKPIIVENEIEVMQSKKLIYQVVNDLQLWVDYSQKTALSSKSLYGRTPIKFDFVKQNSDLGAKGVTLNISVKDKKTFTYKEEKGDVKTANFSTAINSQFGTWQLTPTANLESYIDSNLVVNIQDPDIVSDSYQKGIKVALENKDAPFVNLTTSDKVPQRGKAILNSLMELYLKFATDDKNKLSQKTLKFINFRIDSIRDELDSIEHKLEVYKSSNDITDIVAQAQSYRDLNQANMKALNDVEVQLGMFTALEKYAKSQSSAEKLPPAPAALNDGGLTALYEKLSDLQLKREELLATMPETNPMIASINQQLQTLKDNFNDKLLSVKLALQAQKKQLDSYGTNIGGFLRTVPGKNREYGSLLRLQESKENIYKFLLEKKEQVALRYASSVSDAEIVDDAHAGNVKWPISSAVYGIAVVLGLAVAAGLLFLRESMNDLIMNRKQIEDATIIPILGELAYQDTDNQIVVSEGRSKFAIGEQFRVLRTNLYHLHSNNNSGRVTLFTSSVSGEGKSFVSSNLAVTLAYATRKTIILEMDLRKPKISISFGLSPEHPGIGNYLTEETTDISKLIQPSGIQGLDVLSCGPILPNPSELLEKDTLDRLINELKERYDEIIIDSPPIHLVTDALIIARLADASLYVVRQGYTHKYELEFVNEINETKRFPKFSIVFNGVKGVAGGYGYGYGYSGYGYNSYNSYADKEKNTFGSVISSILKRF